MIFGILTLITALCISAVAIYYSVAGLVAIFAAAAIPIMIMGGTLEIAKLVTAVWLHKYWSKATWWLRSYLSIAVVVLMFITSMGIFGFLSKAHIEQTSASEESIARVESIESEIARQNSLIERAEKRVAQLENSETGADATVQAQIDKEQERIDKAFDRIQPAIEQQNKIITEARSDDASRTKPYEDQLTSIQAEVLRLEQSARDYEEKISTLEADTSATQPLSKTIADIEEEIIRVTNQLQSTEKGQIRAGQAIIGVTSDGLFGGNTRTALAKWVEAQRSRITQIQVEISQIRQDATVTVDEERVRLAEVVSDIRTVQIPALKDRELTMLGKIDEVRQTESPVISTARDEIQRLRESAEAQVAQSQVLIERLRSQLGDKENASQLEADIDEQQERIRSANKEIDALTEEKINLEAEYRKLEAEVGPIKYIAEFVYGENADNNMLEEAVRWVILIIIFVFDPLAVLLLIAAQYTFDFNRKPKDDNGERLRLERAEYERARAQRIIDNPGFDIDPPAPPAEEKEQIKDDQINPGGASEGTTLQPAAGTEDTRRDAAEELAVAGEGEVEDARVDQPTDNNIQDDNVESNERNREARDEELIPQRETVETNERSVSDSTQEQVAFGVEEELEEVIHDNGPIGPTPVTFKIKDEKVKAREAEYEKKDNDQTFVDAKTAWKEANPEETLKHYKNLYIHGKIDILPWEKEEYKQNAEQSEQSLFNKLKK